MAFVATPEIPMAASGNLVKLLKSNLSNVPAPDNYGKLRDKLMNIQPSREAPTIKESPENARRFGTSEHD
jgi:hypothetical protein